MDVNLHDLAKKTATPGLFAQHYAPNKSWIFAPHLRFIDRNVTNLLFRSHEAGYKVLIVSCPVRHGKSLFLSQWLPAWYLCTFPDKRIILTAHEASFARSWGRKVRDIVANESGPDFGVKISQSSRAVNEWEIERHTGGMISTGIGGSLMGRGADLLLIDDYIKNSEQAFSQTIRDQQWDWLQSTALTRLQPGATVVVLATRWNEDDIIGRMIGSDDERVTYLRLPALAEQMDPMGRKPGEALWPDQWPRDALLKIKSSRDPFWWNALYQQNPKRHGKCEFPDEYFPDSCWVDKFPEVFTHTSIAIDPSKGKDTGDPSAICFCGLSGATLYFDVDLERRPVYRIIEDTMAMFKRYQPDAVGIEENAFQDLFAPIFDEVCRKRRHPPLPIHLIKHRNIRKEDRIQRLGPHLARGRVRFLKNEGTQRAVKQLQEFPLCDHDDGPDAMEQAVRLVSYRATFMRKDIHERVYA